MNLEDRPKTKFTSILGMVLRQYRIENNVNSARFAEGLHMSASSYSKAENGQTPITVPMLHKVGKYTGARPSVLLQVTEHYMNYLQQNGWDVLNELEESQTDDLLRKTNEFFEQHKDTEIFSKDIYGQNVSVLHFFAYAPFLDYCIKEMKK